MSDPSDKSLGTWRFTAIASTIGVITLLAMTLTGFVLLHTVNDNELRNNNRACEQANIVRGSIVDFATIIQDNLRAAQVADAGTPSVRTYVAGIEELERIKTSNAAVDCEKRG
jgi:CHASE1-domain containing sensor protein